MLCIGLDIAWFGGSKGDSYSQYDCLTWALLDRGASGTWSLTAHLKRVKLRDRDPTASQLIDAIRELLENHSTVGRVLFALDAPVQAIRDPNLPERASQPPKGTIEQRACEKYLGRYRQAIDKEAGGADNWHPNIQSGAPLAPRVKNLLAGLRRLGFALWTRATADAPKLVIECFPAEAIWAMKRLDRFDPLFTASRVKCYKDQGGSLLTRAQVEDLTRTVLDAFSEDTGNSKLWDAVVGHALTWMYSDLTWRARNDRFHGGKLLDDVVDSMICLATALSYAHDQAHLWQDPDHTDDGHIIGPGCHAPFFPASGRGNGDTSQTATPASLPSSRRA